VNLNEKKPLELEVFFLRRKSLTLNQKHGAQGDQIGRIFAYWAIVLPWAVF
jgi:hypothetical protein